MFCANRGQNERRDVDDLRIAELIEAIERTMAGISDATRAKALGLNANRMFNFNLPERPNKAAN